MPSYGVYCKVSSNTLTSFCGHVSPRGVTHTLRLVVMQSVAILLIVKQEVLAALAKSFPPHVSGCFGRLSIALLA